ncbi:LysR substrate-binding domain-containing protein [Thalassospira mesophila]|uniref:HTH lysR-type domain-containing protein n=1 Tax=Thalassospira mesophila TaxID=1293891 RepID=A0A1Y2KYT6_9PROT|nr:LysR substrate-binding domain-containing protein [Thalassospira mesophila]OSQ37358.1 hypothetical protein TMES_14120 [Thalassospira mesophila]
MGKAPRKPLPPLKSLLTFEAAARHVSFSQAAEELNVTPSAVSHQIQLLEARLGVQLFERHAGRIRLTRDAASYAASLGKAFDQMVVATDVLAPPASAGHLDLLSGHSFAARWLQPNLAGFRDANPTVQIRLQTFSRLEELAERRFDVAICYGEPPVDRKNVHPLLTERIMPLCSPSYARRSGLSDLQDLLRASLVHSDNALTWKDYLARFELDLPDNHKGLWLDRSTLALEAAAEGQGVVLESIFLAQAELASGRLISPFDEMVYGVELTSYFLAFGANFQRKPIAKRFRSWIRKYIAESQI